MKNNCIHHWIIATPSGDTSMGKCRKCNSRKEFSNTVKDVKHARINPITNTIIMTRDINYGKKGSR